MSKLFRLILVVLVCSFSNLVAQESKVDMYRKESETVSISMDRE